MDNERQQMLEELIHRELSKLPERSAPANLIPEVLAAIKARQQRHWWQRPWTCWPMAAKLLSVPLLAGGAGAAVFCVSFLYQLVLVHAEFGLLPEKLEAFSAVWDLLSVLGSAAVLLCRSAGQQWLLAALLLPLGMYLACVGLGTLVYRMAFQQR